MCQDEVYKVYKDISMFKSMIHRQGRLKSEQKCRQVDYTACLCPPLHFRAGAHQWIRAPSLTLSSTICITNFSSPPGYTISMAVPPQAVFGLEAASDMEPKNGGLHLKSMTRRETAPVAVEQ
jgi:hypothetical protein